MGWMIGYALGGALSWVALGKDLEELPGVASSSPERWVRLLLCALWPVALLVLIWRKAQE